MSPLGHITRNRGEVRGVLLWLLYVAFEENATLFDENFAEGGIFFLEAILTGTSVRCVGYSHILRKKYQEPQHNVLLRWIRTISCTFSLTLLYYVHGDVLYPSPCSKLVFVSSFLPATAGWI